MAEKKESSVLFSLRELRGIEEERVQEEEDAQKTAEEERIRSQMESERLTREGEELRVREAADAERMVREQAETRVREEQLRLDEAERKARVEAQSVLDQQRLGQEMQIRMIEAEKTKPKALIYISVGLVLVVSGLGFFAYRSSQESKREKAVAAAALAQLKTEIEGELKAIDQLNTQKDEEFQALLSAQSEEDKRKAQAKLDRTRAKLAERKAALERLRKKGGSKGGKSGRPKKPDKTVNVNCDPGDPLCGI